MKTDLDPAAQCELGVDPFDAVGPVRLGVGLGDEVGEHCVSDRTLWLWPTLLLIEAGFGAPEEPAGALDGEVVRGDHLDRRGLSFGVVSSFRASDRPLSDRELGLTVAEPLLRRSRLGVLGGGQPGLFAVVGSVLAAPVADRLVADVEIVRDAGRDGVRGE
ncbi:hypothetical protein GCM10010467_14990 [Actinocorallia glomerata]|uniref:Uncharacterized protein n=2 Tax=Actinomycetes TaxID=1760 RepID=A0ABP6M555_9MICC